MNYWYRALHLGERKGKYVLFEQPDLHDQLNNY